MYFTDLTLKPVPPYYTHIPPFLATFMYLSRSMRLRPKLPSNPRGADVSAGCSNDVAAIEAHAKLDKARHTAALFWEMGQKSSAEVHHIPHVELRGAVPEYRTRLANYAFWCRQGCPVLRRALELARQRLLRLDGGSGGGRGGVGTLRGRLGAKGAASAEYVDGEREREGV